MTTASKLFYNFHQFVSGIICLAIVATFFGFASGPLLPKDRPASVLALVFCAGTTGLAWYLRQKGYHTAVVILLSLIWIVVLGIIVHAISKARWN